MDSDNIERDGYDAGDFHITMDQDRVLELLTGENLYDDAGVFVRELVQNSIDAVLARRELDKSFGADAGEIHIYSWQDGDYDWFRIEDDGVGMNERIIQEHFLKVGHSYYESAEYKKTIGEKSGKFQPISRFGIGILSCFMSDGDNTRLSLSTLRYDETQPLRMDVNGLHGYYTLAALTPHTREGKPLPAPYYWTEEWRNKTEVRRGVGTTICVRVNRYNLGYASFRELLDKYVVFPTVKITYHDQSASHTYPTQGELMELVHSLNEPDGTMKTHVFPFSDELFERVKGKYPDWEWKERPAITLIFHPLDTLTEGISGVVVILGWQSDAVHPGVRDSDGKVWKPKLKGFDVYLHGLTRQMMLKANPVFGMKDSEKEQKLREKLGCFRVYFDILFNDFFTLVTDHAAREALRLVLDSVRGSGETRTVTAFHGTAADRADLLEIDDKLLAVLLLGGEHRPTVNLARNEITELPLDTLCALTLSLNRRGSVHSAPFAPERFALLPEKEWRDILARHEKQEFRLTMNRKSLYKWETTARLTAGEATVKYHFACNSVYSQLLLAALNRRFSVHMLGWFYYHLALRDKAEEPSSLPVSLCVSWSNTRGALGVINSGINAYNHDHPFFQWLLRERAALAEKVPAVYRGILKTMVLGDDKNTVCRELNDALDRLSRFPDYPFDTKSIPRPTEDDFIQR